MSVWKVILVTVVIFSTGVITGGLIARKSESPPPPTSASHSVTNRPSQGFRPDRRQRRDFIARVGKELELTSGQTQQVEAILRESQDRTRKLWEQIAPQMHAEFKATQEKIRAVLTPEQQKHFEEMMKRRHPQRGEDRRRPGADRPPGPPPPDSEPPGG